MPGYRTQTEQVTPKAVSAKAPFIGHKSVGASTISCPTPTCVIATGELDVVFWTPRLPPLRILSKSLPAGKLKKHYSVQLKSTGGYPPAAWKISSGKLPAGLHLAKGGLLAGTPCAKGTFTVTVEVTDPRDHSFSAHASYKLVVRKAKKK